MRASAVTLHLVSYLRMIRRELIAVLLKQLTLCVLVEYWKGEQRVEHEFYYRIFFGTLAVKESAIF